MRVIALLVSSVFIPAAKVGAGGTAVRSHVAGNDSVASLWLSLAPDPQVCTLEVLICCFSLKETSGWITSILYTST